MCKASILNFNYYYSLQLVNSLKENFKLLLGEFGPVYFLLLRVNPYLFGGVRGISRSAVNRGLMPRFLIGSKKFRGGPGRAVEFSFRA